MKVTYAQIEAFMFSAETYINQKGQKPSHLTHALQKAKKKYLPLYEDYNDLRMDARLDHALVDEKGVIEVYESGAFKYTPEKQKALNKALRKLAEQTVEIEPVLAKSIPADLDLAWYDVFVPFVIAEFPEAEA